MLENTARLGLPCTRSIRSQRALDRAHFPQAFRVLCSALLSRTRVELETDEDFNIFSVE